ncbi:hypothetical protein QJV38_07085 [Listeria cossartiae subsp. cayugensis]|uniref:FtsK gamma domain-containing protein n=1 Tax=Listeria cossartiae subsp. cayugensis TaxID=2713505 RepID=A0ABU2IJM8_9LIST|nr:hypothetical protein [Listeria cossartiae]MDT0064592.1 hypothetical protein [Listeria cossartiae subsp. cayugensis]MDT0079804.1 hypothetical protein [Listeria cossartiae subsp. cayugensis]MDT0082640.1 hypothetical protein [Listeria cossartiae subsp. cayugensis]MDT0086825.1 hypothetical protein [Listeria cossartiae subsp. cayugensis]MDT0099257.1 hypothetical protein [Listeria cossartiae subsp. cayugensis]
MFKSGETVISLIDNDEVREGAQLTVRNQHEGYVDVRSESGAILIMANHQIERECDAENYEWVLEHLRDEGEITVVYVQRWLRISYDRATKICNRLVEDGIAEVQNGIYILEGEEK